jgi:hypothetical protein
MTPKYVAQLPERGGRVVRAGKPEPAPTEPNRAPKSANPLVEAVNQLDRPKARQTAPLNKDQIRAAMDQLSMKGDTLPNGWLKMFVEPGKAITVQDFVNCHVLSHFVSWFLSPYRDGKLVNECRFQGKRFIFYATKFAMKQGYSISSVRRALQFLDREGLIHRKRIGLNRLAVAPVPEMVAKLVEAVQAAAAAAAAADDDDPDGQIRLPGQPDQTTPIVPSDHQASPIRPSGQSDQTIRPVRSDHLSNLSSGSSSTSIPPPLGNAVGNLGGGGGGGVGHPSGVSPSATEGAKPSGPPRNHIQKQVQGEKDVTQEHIQEANLPDISVDDRTMTPDQKAVKLSGCLPWFLKVVNKLNQRPVFNEWTLSAAIEYFKCKVNCRWWEVMAICALGIIKARENPAPVKGFDPYYWSRRFASKPLKIFERSEEDDDDLILARIELEVRYRAASATAEWASGLFASELKRAQGQAANHRPAASVKTTARKAVAETAAAKPVARPARPNPAEQHHDLKQAQREAKEKAEAEQIRLHPQSASWDKLDWYYCERYETTPLWWDTVYLKASEEAGGITAEKLQLYHAFEPMEAIPGVIRQRIQLMADTPLDLSTPGKLAFALELARKLKEENPGRKFEYHMEYGDWGYWLKKDDAQLQDVLERWREEALKTKNG